MHDVAMYMPYTTGLGVNSCLRIWTKDNKILHLDYLVNREQLIDVLKNFTNGTEVT